MVNYSRRPYLRGAKTVTRRLHIGSQLLISMRTGLNEEEPLMQQSQTLSYTEHIVERGPSHLYAREA